MPTCLCAREADSVLLFLELTFTWGRQIFFKSSQPKKGHEGPQQVARALRWHCPAEPRVGQSGKVHGRVW